MTRLLAACGVLLLASAGCDCGGAMVDVDAGSGLHIDARAEAAIVDHTAADLLGLDRSAADGGALDRGVGDGGSADATSPDASASGDGGAGDGRAADLAAALVDASTDQGPANDAATAGDGSATDLAEAQDAGAPDANSSTDRASSTGLDVPCQNGQGWTLFRFHYDDSYSARLDVWDAPCDYSLAPSSACNVVPVLTETLVHDGYALLVSGNSYIRVRFDVSGLGFTRAAVYVQARSYATGSSTGIEVWSPLYGSVFGGPVDNDWEFDWYAMDWTGYLYPDDDPDLTAIQIYAYQGSDSLAVHAVELCVE